jgi:predicted enzyme related to lactoylglutathione lyase
MTDRLPWHHVHITHEDRSAVAAWYVDNLGAFQGEPTKRSENLWYGANLIQVQSDTGLHPAGEVDHIGLGVTDIDSTIAHVLDAGGRNPGGNTITDPFGTRIQLVETDHGCFHHVEIVAPDPLQLANWYALNFGGDVVTCPWQTDKLAIAYDSMWLVIRGGEPGNEPPGRAICHCGWYTPDIHESAARMEANGCRFPVPPREFGTVELAFVEDPSGLWIELVQPPGRNPAELKTVRKD